MPFGLEPYGGFVGSVFLLDCDCMQSIRYCTNMPGDPKLTRTRSKTRQGAPVSGSPPAAKSTTEGLGVPDSGSPPVAMSSQGAPDSGSPTTQPEAQEAEKEAAVERQGAPDSGCPPLQPERLQFIWYASRLQFIRCECHLCIPPFLLFTVFSRLAKVWKTVISAFYRDRW